MIRAMIRVIIRVIISDDKIGNKIDDQSADQLVPSDRDRPEAARLNKLPLLGKTQKIHLKTPQNPIELKQQKKYFAPI